MTVNDAMYHLNISDFRRKKGQDTVAAAAYRAGVRLRNDHKGKPSDFSFKHERTIDVHIYAPESAPDWVFDRTTLWNIVEATENRSDSHLAKEVELAIPFEIPSCHWMEIAEQMASFFIQHGHVVDAALHKGEDGKNPHIHMMLTTRKLYGDEFGAKFTHHNKRKFYYDTRIHWETVGNAFLKAAGSSKRLDHRSYSARGIDRVPGRHRGPDRAERARKRQKLEKEMVKPTVQERDKYPRLADRDNWPPEQNDLHQFDYTQEETDEFKRYWADRSSDESVIEEVAISHQADTIDAAADDRAKSDSWSKGQQQKKATQSEHPEMLFSPLPSVDETLAEAERVRNEKDQLFEMKHKYFPEAYKLEKEERRQAATQFKEFQRLRRQQEKEIQKDRKGRARDEKNLEKLRAKANQERTEKILNPENIEEQQADIKYRQSQERAHAKSLAAEQVAAKYGLRSLQENHMQDPQVKRELNAQIDDLEQRTSEPVPDADGGLISQRELDEAQDKLIEELEREENQREDR